SKHTETALKRVKLTTKGFEKIMKAVTNEEKESPDVYTGSTIRVSTVKDAVSTATQDCDGVEIIKWISGGKYRAIVQHIRSTYQDVMTQTNGDRKAAKR